MLSTWGFNQQNKMWETIGKMMWFLQQINSRKEAGGRCEVEGGGMGEVAID